MAFWTSVKAEHLKVGHILRDDRRGAGYLGGVVKVRNGAAEVRWMKWDPRIEQPMPDTLYHDVSYDLALLVLVRDENDETDQDLTDYVSYLFSKSIGRTITAAEVIAIFDKYAE